MAAPDGQPWRPSHGSGFELGCAADLDPAVIRAIAAGAGVRLGAGLVEAVGRRRAEVLHALRAGAPVYGVTTGMGALSDVRLSEAEQASHQANLLLARATGGPPWLDAAEARAILAVRLRTFLGGDPGVSGALCARLVDFLDAGIVPAVPRTGVGSAGEIIPLAHAFGPLIGVGRVVTAGSDEVPAHEALRRHGLDPFVLGPKEGIALIAGVPGATALGVLRGSEAAGLAAGMQTAAALSIAAARASRDPYTAQCARGDDILGQVLARLREAVGEEPEPRTLQAPVSFRVAGQVLAHLQRAVGGLDGAVRRALVGVTDSPAFLDGRFVGTAGFYGIDLAAHLDQLTAALAHAAEVAAARVHRLLDPRVTGLPAQLASRPGPDAGLVTVHKRAVGEVHALRRLAMPSTVGMVETSGGQEDVQSFTWEAAEVLRGALRHARAVTACELLTAYQALALSDRRPPAGCRATLDRLAEVLDPIEADRPFGVDIERLIGLLRQPWPATTQTADAGPPTSG